MDAEFRPSICSISSGQAFSIQGEFNPKKMSLYRPTFKLEIDANTIPLKWSFWKNGLSGKEKNHSYAVSAVEGGIQTPVKVVNLAGLNLDSSLHFSITLSCNDTNLMVAFNDEWMEAVKYNHTINSTLKITMNGGIYIDKAGYTGEVIQFYIDLTHEHIVQLCT